MTGKETEATAPAIKIANNPKAGEAEFPVVRSPQFFQVTPSASSVWADLSAPPHIRHRLAQAFLP